MKQQQMGTLLQLGIGLFLLGIVIRVVMALAWSLVPIANIAIGIGVVVAIIGLIVPSRR